MDELPALPGQRRQVVWPWRCPVEDSRQWGANTAGG